jgi:hypothetical protein
MSSLVPTFSDVPVRQDEKVFQNTTVDGNRLDICLVWADQCGQPAADAFCKMQGFTGANVWEPANDIGATIVLTGRRRALSSGAMGSLRSLAPLPLAKTSYPAASGSALRASRMSNDSPKELLVTRWAPDPQGDRFSRRGDVVQPELTRGPIAVV